MKCSISGALTIARKWQNAVTEVHGTMMIASGEWVIDFGGHLIIEGNGITVTNENELGFRLALHEAMTFSYADGMLKIGGAGWVLNLYETKDTSIVRLV